jgi:hypothetical protein
MAREQVRQSYADELRELARKLAIAAGTARSRKIYGLEDTLIVAAESARSWADSLDDEDAGAGRLEVEHG